VQVHFRKCREYGLRSTEVYEWSVDGQRWYPIHRNNVQLAENIPAEDIRSIFNAALQGEALLVANYIRRRFQTSRRYGDQIPRRRLIGTACCPS